MKSVVSKWLATAVSLLIAAAGNLASQAISVSLAWDPSPDPGVSGYNVYYGPSGGATTNVLAAGSTSATIANLPAGQQYFTYVTALGNSGLESPPSNYISFTPNAGPVLGAISDQTIAAGSQLVVQLSATDASQPGQVLSYSLISGPSGMTVNAATGVLAWTPSSTQGPSTNPVTVQVSDTGSPPLTDTQSFEVVVTIPNTPPVLAAVADQRIVSGSVLTLQLSATDSDRPAQALTFTMVSGPTGARVDAQTGVLSWTAPQTPGTSAITVKVTDNGVPMLSSSRTFNVVVVSPNIAPVLSAVPNLLAAVGAQLQWQLSATDSDLPAQTLTYSLVSGPAGAKVDSTSGLFTWTPGSTQTGTSTVTVRVTDSGSPALSDSKSFTIAVSAANTAPVLASIANQSVLAGSTLTKQLAATDTDLPAQTLTFSLISGPVGASVTASGLFSWTPTASQTGTSTVTVKVSDNGTPALSDSQSFTVVVSLPNTAPVLASIANLSVLAGNALTMQLTATDKDLPAQTLTFSLISGPVGASVTASGLFSWTPTASQTGTSTVTVKVSDNGTPALSDSQSFTVVVSLPNTAPVLASIANQSVLAGNTLTLQLTATDADLPAQTLKYNLLTGPAGATVSSTGLFSWTPAASQAPNTYTVTVQVTDSGTPSLSNSKSFSVVVKAKNTAPILSFIPDQIVSPGQILMLALTASDPDPGQTLTYNLVSGPTGAHVNPTNGVFTWRLPKSNSPSTNQVIVSVTDDGSPSLSDSQTFTIVVSAKNARNSTLRLGNLPTVTWVAATDSSHAVRFTHPLEAKTQSGNWIHYLEASEDLKTWSTLGSLSDQDELHDSAPSAVARKFYRIRSEETGVDPSTVAADPISTQ